MPLHPAMQQLQDLSGQHGDHFTFFVTADLQPRNLFVTVDLGLSSNPWGVVCRWQLGLGEDATDDNVIRVGGLEPLQDGKDYLGDLLDAVAARCVPASKHKRQADMERRRQASECATRIHAALHTKDDVISVLMAWAPDVRDYSILTDWVPNQSRNQYDSAAHVVRWAMGWGTGMLDHPPAGYRGNDEERHLRPLILQPWAGTGQMSDLYDLVFSFPFDSTLFPGYIPQFNLIKRPDNAFEELWRRKDREFTEVAARRVASIAGLDYRQALEHMRLAPYHYARARKSECRKGLALVHAIIKLLQHPSQDLPRAFGSSKKAHIHIVTYLDPRAVVYDLGRAGRKEAYVIFKDQLAHLAAQKAKDGYLDRKLVDKLFPHIAYHFVHELVKGAKRPVQVSESSSAAQPEGGDRQGAESDDSDDSDSFPIGDSCNPSDAEW